MLGLMIIVPQAGNEASVSFPDPYRPLYIESVYRKSEGWPTKLGVKG